MYASIILPTYNERENVGQMVEALRRVFGDRQDWEVVIVDDDSPDRTWEHVQELGATDPRDVAMRDYFAVDAEELGGAMTEKLAELFDETPTAAPMRQPMRPAPATRTGSKPVRAAS